MPPRPITPDRADRILDAAATVFARDGFAAARMEDVATEAGLSKGTVYLYFDGKEQLIDALVDRLVGWEVRRLEQVAAADGPILDRLLGFVSGYAADVAAAGELGPVVLEVYARAGRAGTIQQTLRRSFEAYVAALQALVAAGVERGELRATDARVVALEIAALLEGIVLLWLVDPTAVAVDQVAEQGVRLLLEGLRIEAGEASPAARPPR